MYESERDQERATLHYVARMLVTCTGKHAMWHVGTNVGQGCSELWKAELCRAELESGTFGERIFGALCVDAGCFSFRTTPRRHMGGSGKSTRNFRELACALACTPASVRPLAITSVGMPHSRESLNAMNE